MTWDVWHRVAQIGTVPHFSYLNGLGSRNPQVAALLFLILPYSRVESCWIRHPQTLVNYGELIPSTRNPAPKPKVILGRAAHTQASACRRPSPAMFQKFMRNKQTKRLDQGVWIQKGDIHLMVSTLLKCEETSKLLWQKGNRRKMQKARRGLKAWGRSSSPAAACANNPAHHHKHHKSLLTLLTTKYIRKWHYISKIPHGYHNHDPITLAPPSTAVPAPRGVLDLRVQLVGALHQLW